LIKSQSWSEYFFEMADLVSSKSKDPSTKIGAIIVGEDNEILSTGFNGFPRGVDESKPERWERPIKYTFVEHAERNAIYNAARNGVALKGSIMYVNFSEVCPCSGCTRGIIQSGIKKIICGGQPFPGKGDHWEEDIKIARIMLEEAGIEVIQEED